MDPAYRSKDETLPVLWRWVLTLDKTWEVARCQERCQPSHSYTRGLEDMTNAAEVVNPLELHGHESAPFTGLASGRRPKMKPPAEIRLEQPPC